MWCGEVWRVVRCGEWRGVASGEVWRGVASGECGAVMMSVESVGGTR